MHINVRHIKDAEVIRLEGDFLCEPDQARLRSRVAEVVGQGKKFLVIDLAHLRHINSCGLGSLICALTTVRRAGGELQLAGVHPDIMDLFRMTRLDTVFSICGTVRDAEAQFHPN